MPKFKIIKVKTYKERLKELEASIKDLEDKIESLEEANKSLDIYFERKPGELDY